MGSKVFLNVPAYKKWLKSNVGNKLSVIGAILIALSPFLPWAFYYINDNGTKDGDFGNLFFMKSFDLIKFLGEEKGVVLMPVFGAVIFVVGIMLLLWDTAPFAPTIRSVRDKIEIPAFRIICVALVVIATILAILNKELRETILDAREIMEEYSGVKVIALYCIGPYMAIAGVVIWLVGVVIQRYKKG